MSSELDKAREMFQSLGGTPQEEEKSGLDLGGDPAALEQLMQQFQIDPGKMQLLQSVSQADPGWIPALFEQRPEWDITDCYFNASVIDVARSFIVAFLTEEVQSEVFPLERIMFFVDNPTVGEAEAHSRLQLYEADPQEDKSAHIRDRIPFQLNPETKEPTVDASGNKVRIEPDAMLMLRTPKGKTKGKLEFTSTIVLVTRSFIGTANISVKAKNAEVRVESTCLLRPAEGFEEWGEIVPLKE